MSVGENLDGGGDVSGDGDRSQVEPNELQKKVGGDEESVHSLSSSPERGGQQEQQQQEQSPSTEERMIEEFATNPMMDRVQSALREQLQKTHDRVKRECLDREEALRAAKKEREDCGVELYGMQQQLARLQRNLESVKDKYLAVVDDRRRDEGSIADLNKTRAEKKAKVEEMQKKVAKRKAELDALNETVRQARKYNEEVKGEVAVTRRAAHKAEENVKELEKSKKTQDLYIDGLHEQVKRLEADVGLSEAQLKAQKKQTEDAKKMLQETGAELELLAFEKKQLVQQWKSSLVALSRRDQALAAATKSLKDAQSASKDYKGENTGLRREIHEAKVSQDNLALSRDRLENEARFIEGSIAKVQADQESISERFELLQKTVALTNEEEAKVQSAINKINSEIAAINHKIEMVTRERQSLEQRIGTYKHEQTTMSKATMNLVKEEKALLASIHENEIEAANIQNELARLKIDALNTQTHSSQLEKKLAEELASLKQQDDDVERIGADIKKCHGEVDKKMNQVDRLNRKYEKMVDAVDEPEPLGPLEAMIKGLSGDIAQEESESERLQREWLADQTALIQTISDTDATQEKNRELDARLNILKQKRLRLIKDININEAEMKAVESDMEGMHSDMLHLNDLIGKNTKLQNELANENTIKEKEFVRELQELERESIQMEARIAEVKAAKKETLDEIVEAERQLLVWESKIQLEKETQAALHNSKNAIETKGMEKEIHRMKHRLETLKRDQEKMLREMELAIHKREDIAVKYQTTKGGGKGKSDSAKTVTIAELKKKGTSLKAQLKEAARETSAFRTKVEDARKKLHQIRCALEKANTDYDDLQASNKQLNEDIDRNRFEKQRLLAKSDRKQEMVQKYVALKEGKTEPVSGKKDEFDVEKQLTIATAKMKRIQNVISGISIKKSQYQEVFDRVAVLAADVFSESE